MLLRDPARLDAELAEHVEPAVGDLRDADYVTEATEGIDAIFWVPPDDWSLPDPYADAERTADGLAAAMRKNRIGRVVFQSSIGAELRHGAGFTDDEQRGAGLSEVVVEGIVGMSAGFTPEQSRCALTTTPSGLVGWAATHLRPVL